MPGAKVEAVLVDLADLSTIRTFAGKALDGGRPLDVLVNNAGTMMSILMCILRANLIRSL